MKKMHIGVLGVFLVIFTAVLALAVEQQVIAGAGPSTKIVELFVEQLAKNPQCSGYQFQVPKRSAKHAGGLKCSDKYLFGRTGRPLNSKEVMLNKGEIYLARVPIAFVVGAKVGIKELSLLDIQKIFLAEITNWKDLGGPDAKIALVGRESTEALFSVLKKDHPFFQSATFDKVFIKDHQVVNFMNSSDGQYAIAFGAKPNFTKLSVVTIEGFGSGVSLGLVYDKKNESNSAVKAATIYAKSDEWKKIVISADLLPAS